MVLARMVAVAFFWGGTFVAARVVAATLNPVDGAALRFLLGSAGLALALARAGGWVRVARRDFWLLVGMGMTGIVSYNLFFFAGMRLTSAGRASLIIANNPIGIMLFAWLIYGERLNRRQLAGIGVSLIGAALVVLDRHDAALPGSHFGQMLIFGCVASWIAYTMFARAVLRRVSPLVATTYSTLLGTVVLVVGAAPFASLAKVRSMSAAVWVAGAFLGLAGTALAFTWFLNGVSVLGASRAGQFINLVPVFAVLLSTLLLGERPSPLSLVGGVLVIGGLLLTQRSASPAPTGA